ncbi:MAG: type II toxin-antitoxin system RelE/ParE family toxin [Candidatus Binataceae bacterium]|nr:type II toxin-antitoxin system RelE/ParE family toxin [Candidatus Binataceae bacterium]
MSLVHTVAAGRRLVILLAFVKKTEKTSRRAIELARKRLREIGP